MPHYDVLKFISPELILLLFIGLALLVDLFVSNGIRYVPGIGIAGCAAALLKIVNGSWSRSLTLFSGAYTVDPFGAFFKVLALSVGILVILLSIEYVEKFIKQSRSEFYLLTLFSVLAIMIVSSSTDLIMIFLSIEFLSLMSYLVAGYMKSDRLSAEASIKYLLFGLVASGIMLYGISLVYGMTGSTNLYDLAELMKHGDPWVNTLALIFVLAGFGYKISLVPFHLWAPDVYEGAPTPMTAFFSVGPKLAGFAVLGRTFLLAFSPLASDWISLLGIVAIVTMTLGNCVALSQQNLKRLLAYSSIAQAGTILIGLVAVASGQGLSGVMIYLFIYSFMNLGVFAIVIALGNQMNSSTLDGLKGLSTRNPFLAAMLTIFLLSLAGVPPLGGFIAKFFVFGAAIESGHIVLAMVAIVNSVIAVYYYLNLVRLMYLVPATETAPIRLGGPLRAVVLIALVVVMATGLFPSPLIEWVNATHLLAHI